MPIINQGIITYEKAAGLSLDYSFAHYAQAKLLWKYMLTKKIDFLRELATVVEDFYHRLCMKCFGYRSPNKEATETCWNIVTTIIVCLFDELRAVRLVAEDAFNHTDRSNKL